MVQMLLDIGGLEGAIVKRVKVIDSDDVVSVCKETVECV